MGALTATWQDVYALAIGGLRGSCTMATLAAATESGGLSKGLLALPRGVVYTMHAGLGVRSSDACL